MSARLVIAAPESTSGKTTLTAGLIRALRRRGLTVQPFKCGPDYIDPGYHTLAAERACRNLDTWLLTPDQVRALFSHASADADLALVEGVMGLFDGFGALEDAGSTADVAQVLDAPVVLVIDIRGMARSVAALVAGFQRFNPSVNLAGVIFNRAGSARHAEICATAVSHYTGLPCLGYVERRSEFALPERHLGLVTTAEAGPWADVIDQLADAISDTCDLEALLALARAAPALPAAAALPAISTAASGPQPVIAIAQDQAFSFAYREMFELLTAAGARLAPFSPLQSDSLPANTQGLILSGGFPELYAEQLSRNTALQQEIRAAHAAGLPIYAECGGLMYLTEALHDLEGNIWPMTGLLPGHSAMSNRVIVGYRAAIAADDSPLFKQGTGIRGHEFHYSRWENRPPDLAAAYSIQPRADEAAYSEGARIGNLLASYIHLFWLAYPAMAQRFVETCRAAGAGDG